MENNYVLKIHKFEVFLKPVMEVKIKLKVGTKPKAVLLKTAMMEFGRSSAQVHQAMDKDQLDYGVTEIGIMIVTNHKYRKYMEMCLYNDRTGMRTRLGAKRNE